MSTPRTVCVYKPTTDDWYPPFNMNGETMVRVKFLEFCDYSGWRVCVWGRDDFGMQRDWTSGHELVAYAMFLKIIEQPVVNQKFLREQGFSLT